MYFVLPIPLGLATRAFFDALAGESAGLNAWSAIALLVAVQVVEVLAGPALGNPWSPLQQKSQVLLQRNLFAGILRGYGRHGLPESVGETISRFRDDPESIADALDALCDLIGRAFFAVGAAVVMWRIDPTITAALFVPLLLSSFLTEALGNRIMAYRAASREATGRLTGFLGELLGAQLARQGRRRGAATRSPGWPSWATRAAGLAVRDSVFGEMLDSLNVNLVHLGTGLVLLLGAQAIGDGTFTVGDFALFVVYLDQLTWYPAEIGRLISDLKRIEVSFGRMQAIVPGEPPAALVAPAPVYLRGALPEPPPPPPRERLERLEVRGLTYAHPGGAGGIVDVSFALERGSFTVDHRPDRRRQDDAAARPARPAAARRRRDPLERPAGRRSGRPSSSRRAAPTRRRCRGCSARRCARTCCSGGPTTRPRSTRRSTRRCWSRTWRRSSAGSTRWSGRAA